MRLSGGCCQFPVELPRRRACFCCTLGGWKKLFSLSFIASNLAAGKFGDRGAGERAQAERGVATCDGESAADRADKVSLGFPTFGLLPLRSERDFREPCSWN